MLEDILVCPVCKAELLFHERDEPDAVSCSSCRRIYQYRDGFLDLTPIPPADAPVLEKWSLWEQLQENGLFSYTEAPDLNLSVGAREDAVAFAAFCNLTGLVLDIGCGPQEIPSYGTNFSGQLVGIDPLRGSSAKRFDFVQGIGEYLPFRSAVFDRVLFATSLDHVLDPKLTLLEARRVVKPGGTVNIWFDSVEVDEALDAPGYRPSDRVRRVLSLLRQGDVTGIMRRLAFRLRPNKLPPSMSYLSKLKVPNGAVDHFHFAHIERSTLEAWLKDVGLVITEISKFDQGGNYFVRSKSSEH